MIWHLFVPTVNPPAVLVLPSFFCYLKNVGFAPDKKIPPSDALLKHIASRLKLTGDLWPAYLSGRDTTRREHLTELYRYLGVKAFTGKIQQDCIIHLLPMATRSKSLSAG
nr:Transposase and inactivated derivatives, TnpA family [Salmonella sp. NCTC 7297]